MPKSLIVVLALYVFSVPTQSVALTIGITNHDFDFINYYGIGLCNDKFGVTKFYSWGNFTSLADKVQLNDSENICVVAHGQANSAGGIDGKSIAEALKNKIDNPENAGYILLMSCRSAVVDRATGSSLLSSVVDTLDEKWKGKVVYGGAGVCVANRNGETPYFRTVLKSDLKENCEMQKLRNKQQQLKTANKTAKAFNECKKKADDVSIAECVYAHSDVISFYKELLDYLDDNDCVNTDGTRKKDVP